MTSRCATSAFHMEKDKSIRHMAAMVIGEEKAGRLAVHPDTKAFICRDVNSGAVLGFCLVRIILDNGRKIGQILALETIRGDKGAEKSLANAANSLFKGTGAEIETAPMDHARGGKSRLRPMDPKITAGRPDTMEKRNASRSGKEDRPW